MSSTVREEGMERSVAKAWTKYFYPCLHRYACLVSPEVGSGQTYG
jgi:hypothetical protein